MTHEIHDVASKFDQEEIRKLQGKDPHYVKLIENMKLKSKTRKGDYNLDPNGTLHQKIKDHGKKFRELLVSKTIPKYVLYKSHNSVGQSSTTRLYQFLKRQYYWKSF